MNLELLPDEILLDLFDYFNGVDLLLIFYGINSRFNILLYQQYRAYRFRFNILKRHFDMICQQHLPFITNQVINLHLIDEEDTPEEISLFLTYIPSFSQFTRLQSLSLHNIHSYEVLMKIIDECHHNSNLTHLNLNECFIRNKQAAFQLIVNTIWSFPKLIFCKFEVYIEGQEFFPIPTIISLSLKHLSVHRNHLKLNKIHQLLEYTPHLKWFTISVNSCDANNYTPSLLSTLIDFDITVYHTSNASQKISLLKTIPNLRRLSVCLTSNLIDGHQWERIIRDYLPKLKVFQLQMSDTIFDDDIENQMDVLISSFRSSFWIDEHRWFIRCIRSDFTIHLYTLSKIFHYHQFTLPKSFKSTYPQDNLNEFYQSITRVYDHTFFASSIPSDIYLPNIRRIYMRLPVDDQFWSIFLNLNRLYSLTITSHSDIFQSQLQTLLDLAPHLDRITILQDESLPLQMSLFKYTNPSIRKLRLNDYHHFNEDECILLSDSPLGRQCQILSIIVKNRASIISLVKHMNNLRALYVTCQDEQNSQYLPSSEKNDNFSDEKIQNKDQLVQWLKDRLPSSCLVVRDALYASLIRMWM